MERLWTKPFILITVSMLFLFTGFYMLLPTLPLFIRHIGGSESQVGLVVGVFMLSSVILRPVIGGLLDRYGRRPFILWGLLVFSLVMYMYSWIEGVLVLLMLRMIQGLSWAVSTTGIFTVITDIIPSSRRGEGMGWFSTAMTLAMAIGPMFGIWIAQNLSYQALFYMVAGLSFIALILMFLANTPFQAQKKEKHKLELFEKSVLPITISVFFLNIAYGGITAFVPLFTNSLAVNSGAFFLVYAATLVLSRPIAGKLSDRHGEKFVIIPALFITVIALISLSISGGVLGILISAVLYGIGFGSAQPALQAATLRLAHPERRGIANASLLTATDLGIGLGSIMLGWIAPFTSYSVLFIVSAVSVSFALLFYQLLANRKREKNKKVTSEISSDVSS